jgi:hypothetical protein
MGSRNIGAGNAVVMTFALSEGRPGGVLAQNRQRSGSFTHSGNRVVDLRVRNTTGVDETYGSPVRLHRRGRLG